LRYLAKKSGLLESCLDIFYLTYLPKEEIFPILPSSSIELREHFKQPDVESHAAPPSPRCRDHRRRHGAIVES
jgi:hypothetical protein